MNLGQFLTAKSPLPSGTVAQHLAAIAASVGTGAGETVFASMFSVQVEQPSVTVTRRAKRQVQEAQVAAPKIRQGATEKNVAVFSVVPSAAVFTAPDAITVLLRTESVTATTRLASETITRKRAGNAINSTYQSINILN